MSGRPPEAVLWDGMRGVLVTRALAVVADLGIADALAAGPQSVPDLAAANGADADTLHRLLRALASDGIFLEENPGVFRNTAASDLLRAGTGWGDFAHLFGGAWLSAAGALDASGEPTFERLNGSDFWSWLAANPQERAAFDRAMAQGWQSRVERLERLEWRGDETVVDVGGGDGSLLAALLSGHPEMRGVVNDLPETVRDETIFGDRLEFVSGSFFERVPPGDVYVLSTILHDWDDEHAEAILRTIHRAAVPGTRLAILDAVIAPGNDPDGTKWLDLLIHATLGGRERDEKQWRALLDRSGFDVRLITDGLIEATCR